MSASVQAEIQELDWLDESPPGREARGPIDVALSEADVESREFAVALAKIASDTKGSDITVRQSLPTALVLMWVIFWYVWVIFCYVWVIFLLCVGHFLLCSMVQYLHMLCWSLGVCPPASLHAG